MGVGIQSPIPLIYLVSVYEVVLGSWDSVTYPLDILGGAGRPLQVRLGFSHLSP